MSEGIFTPLVNAAFQEVANITSSASGTPFFASIIDSTNTFAYFGGEGNPMYSFPKIVKVRLSNFTEEASLTASQGNFFYSGIIDPANTFAYFATDGNTPTYSKIIKIQLSDFSEVGSLTLDVGRIESAVIDSTGTFAYFGQYEADPAKIIKINLSTFSIDSELTISGKNIYGNSFIDSTNTFAYFHTLKPSSPYNNRIIKIKLSDFTEEAYLDLSAYGSGTGIIDPSSNYAYFEDSAYPVKIAKIDLSTFTVVANLTTSIDSSYLDSALVDKTGTYAYFAGMNGDFYKIIQVQLSNFSETDNITINDVGGELGTVIIDSTGGYSYWGSHNNKVIKVQLHSSNLVINGGYNEDGGIFSPKER